MALPDKLPAPVEPQPLVYRFPTGFRATEGGAALNWPTGQGPFGQVTRAEPNPAIATVQWVPDALSVDECAAVIAEGKSLPSHDGRVELGAHSYRVSHIAWIEPNERTNWLFHRLGVLFTNVNRAYGFDMVGFVDALQFTEYGPDQHFEWHLDIGRDQSSLRKLSMTIQLSAEGDYDGGELDFVGLLPNEQGRRQGSATFFPSYLGHRVRPVTRGIRRSLVAWGSGLPFR